MTITPSARHRHALMACFSPADTFIKQTPECIHKHAGRILSGKEKAQFILCYLRKMNCRVTSLCLYVMTGQLSNKYRGCQLKAKLLVEILQVFNGEKENMKNTILGYGKMFAYEHLQQCYNDFLLNASAQLPLPSLQHDDR